MKFTRSKLLLISTCTASALTGLFFSGYNYHANAEAGSVNINAGTSGTGTFATGLSVTGGGASITGGLNNNTGGITNAGALGGATTGAFSSSVTFPGSGIWDSSGNVGIGTTPAVKLHVQGGELRLQTDQTYISFFNTAGVRQGYLQFANDAMYLNNERALPMYFYNNGANRMTLTSSGSVGIGNTPSYKLDVTGDIRSTTTMRANGGTYFCGGDDACLNDVNVANTVAIYGAQNSLLGTLRLGNGANDISGYNNNVGVNTLVPITNWNVAGTSSPFDQLTLTDTTSGGTTYVHRKSGAIIEFYNGTNGAYGGAINTTGAYYNGSDIRLKKDIKTIPSALDRILNLRAVTYHSTNQKNTDPLNVGFIAQEVENIFPEAVVENDTTKGYKALTYQYLFTYGIKAIQEQQVQIENLSKIVKTQQEQIDQLLKEMQSK
jgi:hypothetical protein